MDATIQFFTKLQTKECCVNQSCSHRINIRTQHLKIKKIEDIPTNVRIEYGIREKMYNLIITMRDNEPSKSPELYNKVYPVLTDEYTVKHFVEELQNDFQKMRFSKLESKLYTEPIEEDEVTIVTNFLTTDCQSIHNFNQSTECGVCYEDTKRELTCCNNTLCLPCQINIKKKFIIVDGDSYDATPCPFCRKAINTDDVFDEDDDE